MAELIAFSTTRYRCPHCRRSYAQKASAAGHLARCWLSPAVQSCRTCVHFEDDPGDVEVGLEGGAICHQDVHLNGYRCSTCGQSVYPDGSGDCTCEGGAAKPVIGLRVQCPLWESS